MPVEKAVVEKVEAPFHEIAEMPGVQLLREETRRYIAYGALAGFFTILGLIVLVGWIIFKLPIDDVLKVLATTAAVLSGIVGAVVGFYFRESERQQANENAFNERAFEAFERLEEALDRRSDKLLEHFLRLYHSPRE